MMRWTKLPISTGAPQKVSLVFPRRLSPPPALSLCLLNVFFTAPAGVMPTNHTFMASLMGTVVGNAGGVFVDFGNAPQMFSYTGGTFTLEVSDVNLTNTTAGTTVAVTGNIRPTATVVPEPSTYLLMASGLAGMGMMYRRRRNA